jgi:hypothetical protein
VKELDAPKNYRSWVNFTKSRRGRQDDQQ